MYELSLRVTHIIVILYEKRRIRSFLHIIIFSQTLKAGVTIYTNTRLQGHNNIVSQQDKDGEQLIFNTSGACTSNSIYSYIHNLCTYINYTHNIMCVCVCIMYIGAYYRRRISAHIIGSSCNAIVYGILVYYYIMTHIYLYYIAP